MMGVIPHHLLLDHPFAAEWTLEVVLSALQHFRLEVSPHLEYYHHRNRF